MSIAIGYRLFEWAVVVGLTAAVVALAVVVEFARTGWITAAAVFAPFAVALLAAAGLVFVAEFAAAVVADTDGAILDAVVLLAWTGDFVTAVVSVTSVAVLAEFDASARAVVGPKAEWLLLQQQPPPPRSNLCLVNIHS